MDAKGWMFFNVLVNHFQSQNAPTFLNQLPKETLQALQQYPTQSAEAAAAMRIPEQVLGSIHFSWLIPILEQYPESLRAVMISCLPSHQRQGIRRQLGGSKQNIKPSPLVQNYVMHQLATQIGAAQALPLEYVPESPMKPLMALSREQLIMLIDYLGLRDLAETLRPIVDNRLLQAVHRCLQPTELQLLRAYLHQRDTLKVAKLDFSKWDGQRDSLRLLYHQRGLARLGRALSEESPDLIWHIRHRLDQKRAELLANPGVTKESPRITQTLRLQVVAVLEFLERKHGE